MLGVVVVLPLLCVTDVVRGGGAGVVVVAVVWSAPYKKNANAGNDTEHMRGVST